MSLLRAATLRHLWRHPAQLTLALVGLALGVGTIVAVDIATASARRALELSLEAVNGAATDQIVGGSRGIDEELYVRLRRSQADGARFAPLLSGYVSVGERTLELLGVDPFASRELTGAENPVPAPGAGGNDELRGWLTEPGTVLMSATTAQELALTAARSFELNVGGVRHPATLLAATSTGGAGFEGLVLTDIAQAQEWLDIHGRISRIDVRLPPGAPGAAARARLRLALPPGLELRSTQAEAEETVAMTDAFTTNLRAMSLLALLVGTFLIYGAVSFAVVQRRALLAVLRALGATRAQVLAGVLGEAALLGIVGAGCGVLLGLGIGTALVHLVSQTINDLYFVVAVREISVPPGTLVRALAAGVVTALIAALLPALEVAASAPQLALQRSSLERRAVHLSRVLLVAGALFAAAAFVLVYVSQRSLMAGFAALFLLLLSVAAVTPAALRALAAAAARVAGRVSPVARLALSGIAGSLSRTGVAIAALGMALTAMIGVAIMVGSFRESLRDWLTQTLRADVYVSAPGPADAPERRLDAALTHDLLALPGIRTHSQSRRVVVGSPAGPIDMNAVSLVPESHAAFHIDAAQAGAAWAAFGEGAVFVSEPLAWRLHLRPQDLLRLSTARGVRDFVIAGVYREYGNERGEVLMDLAHYRSNWDDPDLSGLGIYLQPGVSAVSMVAALRTTARGRQGLFIRSNAELRELSLAIFERTFVITRVLYWLAAGVAAVGLVSALLAWELERGRELALLRSLGLTAGATGLMVLAQTVFMALVALAAAIPAGLLTAVVLTRVINRRAFGWQIDLHFGEGQFMNALLLALAAALIAGCYPAWRSAHAPLARVLREE